MAPTRRQGSSGGRLLALVVLGGIAAGVWFAAWRWRGGHSVSATDPGARQTEHIGDEDRRALERVLREGQERSRD